MGIGSMLGKGAKGAAKLVGKATVKTAELTGKAARAAGKAVYDHRAEIASAAKTAAVAAGKAGAATAGAVARSGKYVGEKLYENREPIKRAGASVLNATAKATTAGARTVYDHRGEIMAAGAGAVRGAGHVASGIAGVLDGPAIEAHLRRVAEQSREYRERVGALPSRARLRRLNHPALVDSLVVGGETLAAYLHAGQVPADIQRAYELAYPQLAARVDFTDRVESLDGDALLGFTSAIKGKLFEIQYAQYLNDGNLPDGYRAELAHSPTQAGWDLRIVGHDGEVRELLQAKATDSVGYVKEALQEYPHIDVVSTSEVHAALVMEGFASDVVNSGISDAALTAAVTGAYEQADVAVDFVPSALSLAMIAFSAYTQEGLDRHAKARQLGDRAVRSYVSYLAAGGDMLATQTWWLALVGGVGSRVALSHGHAKHRRLVELKRLVAANERVLARLRARAA